METRKRGNNRNTLERNNEKIVVTTAKNAERLTNCFHGGGNENPNICASEKY